MFKLMNGDDAPAIELPDTDGNIWRLNDYRGNMVLLHFGRGEY